MNSSIATRISRAALLFTMGVVLVLGVASYIFIRKTLKSQIEKELTFETAKIALRIEAALKEINNTTLDGLVKTKMPL
jgi:CHASE3 domain sensor protein